jgi:hypothetical protein
VAAARDDENNGRGSWMDLGGDGMHMHYMGPVLFLVETTNGAFGLAYVEWSTAHGAYAGQRCGGDKMPIDQLEDEDMHVP